MTEAVWQKMKKIWEFLNIIKFRIFIFIDEFIVFMILCSVHAAAQSKKKK